MLLTFPFYLLLLARVLDRLAAWVARVVARGIDSKDEATMTRASALRSRAESAKHEPEMKLPDAQSGRSTSGAVLVLGLLVAAVMIWPFKLNDRAWENYIHARRYREGQEYIQLTNRLRALAAPGAKVLAPPVYWIGLHDHSFSDIYVYERVERQY